MLAAAGCGTLLALLLTMQLACGGGVVVLVTADSGNVVRWNAKENSARRKSKSCCAS
jgi:hypothetical protein